jgi:hypothetical protein
VGNRFAKNSWRQPLYLSSIKNKADRTTRSTFNAGQTYTVFNFRVNGGRATLSN